MQQLIDRTEALALAAILQEFRSDGALAIRRPSFENPTFWSRPLTHTSIQALAPTATFVPVLEWRAPIQYIATITQYAVATLEPLTSPGVEFQLLFDGALLPGVNLPAGVDVSKGAEWPLWRRPLHLVLNETHLFTIAARNLAAVPKTVLAAIWGWNYDTIDIEFGPTQGITDA